MKKQKTVLGKGLNSMLGGETLASITTAPLVTSDGASTIASLPLSLLRPNREQPRRHFDSEALAELAESIKHLGIVQPITVQPSDNGHYTIISGERRYRAAQIAGIESVPVYIREVNDKEALELALVENIQREDLNAIEIALAYQGLLEHIEGSTHELIASRVGKKRSSVTNYLRLLRLPAEIQLGLSERRLEMGHARALLQIEDAERQMELYHLCISEQLSVREVEDLARAIKESIKEEDLAAEQATPKTASKRLPEYRALEQHLGKVFGSKVSLRCNSKGKGSISIPFANEEEMERLLALLQRIQ